MLVLSRKVGESIVIGGRIVITVARVDGDSVRLGIEAPMDVPVHRQEVYDEIHRNNREALTESGQKVPKLRARIINEPETKQPADYAPVWRAADGKANPNQSGTNMVINTNMTAEISAKNLSQSQAMLSKSLERLSSGSKLTSPADDAAGLAVATRLDAQVQRLNAANSNVSNAVSFLQTQDGYLSKIAKALQRMSELSILSQDATKTDADRALYNSEFTQLANYITTAGTKAFNGVSLFSANSLAVTIDSEGGTITMNGIDLATAAYNDATAATVDTTANAAAALTAIKTALDQLATNRASIGAYQSRLDYTAQQLTISKENLTAASSRIQDVDVADESTRYARYNILTQAGTAMLAQANQLPSTVLKLLQ